MALPKQIQAQIDAADALLNQPPVATPSPVPAPAPAPVVEAPEPAPAVEPLEAPVPATPAPPQPEPWEQRYRTLQGLHNAQMREAQAEKERLAREVEELRQRSEQPPAQPQSAVDPKDADVFGEDLMAAVERLIVAKIAPIVQRVDERIKAVESNVTNTSVAVAQTAEDVFWDQLFKRVPDFEAVNTSQEFIAWLQEVDPLAGTQRQKLLDTAGKSMSVDRVCAIVNAFKATITPPATAPAAAPAPTPASQLAKQVSPRSSGGAAPVPAGPQMFSVKTVEAFYRDVAAGKYRGREAEQAQLEQMYNAALAEGRLTQ